MGPFDLPGPQFLTLYGILLVAAIAFGLIIPRLLRPAGKDGPVSDEDEIAYLAGGAIRLAEAVTATLLASGAIAMQGKRVAIMNPSARTSRAGQAVLALPTPANWNAIASAVKAEGRQLWHRLAARGLMITGPEASRLRKLQTLPYFLLLAFGAIKLAIGMVRDRPVGFLVALLVVTAVAAMLRYGNVDRRTQAGVNAVQSARQDADRLRRAPQGDESGMAVALFGTAVLAGSAFAGLHDMRTSSGGSSDSGGCSSDSSGCSGDSGGGGCGGCGGGD